MKTTLFTMLVCAVTLFGCSEQAKEQVAGSSNKQAAAGSAQQATGSSKQQASNNPQSQTPASSEQQEENGSQQQDQNSAEQAAVASARQPVDRQENNAATEEPAAENIEDQIAKTKVEDSAQESAETINPVDAHKAEAPSSSEYTVKAGDTLTKIARNHDTTVQALVDLNALSNPGEIAVGEKLRLSSQ